MASSFKGLYVQRLGGGVIHSVQVVDLAGISLPLDPMAYVDRGIQPPIDSLPDVEQYHELQKKP